MTCFNARLPNHQLTIVIYLFNSVRPFWGYISALVVTEPLDKLTAMLLALFMQSFDKSWRVTGLGLDVAGMPT